ncbi:Aldehyde reductase 2 [Paramyrothecium foliicola]|nr:Aldehyde reductase 2 [Paramyrothecium foliicola]
MSSIPPGSIVLVTGMSGLVGSHVTDQLLHGGYRVRGTVRTMSKAERLIKLWETKYGKGRIEVVIVEDMTKPGVFDDIVQGVFGIAHVATDTTFSPDPFSVINGTVNTVQSILDAASRSSSVKRFVYTGSSSAFGPLITGVRRKFDASSWNEESIRKAWAPPPYTPDRVLDVYSASKTLAEQAVFTYAKEKQPQFVVNSVALCWNFGKLLDPTIAASSTRFIKWLWDGEIDAAKASQDNQWFVDVQDSARLHVAALANPNVENERIIAYAGHFTWNDVLRHARQIRPDHDWIENFVDEDRKDLSEIDNTRGTELLKAMGRHGWTSLHDSLKLNLEAL